MIENVQIVEIKSKAHVYNLEKIYGQENRWKRRMLPKWLLSIKGRTCNTTPLVHQDMTTKKTFYEKNKER